MRLLSCPAGPCDLPGIVRHCSCRSIILNGDVYASKAANAIQEAFQTVIITGIALMGNMRSVNLNRVGKNSSLRELKGENYGKGFQLGSTRNRRDCQ